MSTATRPPAPEDILRTLREHKVLPDGARAAFVAGSVVRGWGNPGSDLDIYVVTDAPVEIPPSSRVPVALDPCAVPVKHLYVRGWRWDVEYWLDLQVDQLMHKLSWRSLDRSHADSELLTHWEVEFAARITHGISLTPPEWLSRRQRQVTASAFRSVVVTRALAIGERLVEDVVGQLEAGDSYSAVLSARMALGAHVDALLAMHGHLGVYEKWRARAFAQSTQDVVSFEEYWDLETMRSYDVGQPNVYANQVLALCRRIAAQAVI
ncbi:nucleotidyltransferase domain-containing protein [Micromonospora sp. DT62]|uniref:nucleotidyltransferase domain-containing protein n=1 Tax=Micromonospora sp. DT62 TaxID=3416521 RepID=UPI003CEC91C3